MKLERNSLMFQLGKSMTVWSIILLVPTLAVVAVALKFSAQKFLDQENSDFVHTVATLVDDAYQAGLGNGGMDAAKQKLQALLEVLQSTEPDDEYSGVTLRIVVRSSDGTILAISHKDATQWFAALLSDPTVRGSANLETRTITSPQFGLVVHISFDSSEATGIVLETMSFIAAGILLLVPVVILAGGYLTRMLQSSFTTLSQQVETRSVENLRPLPIESELAEFRPAIQSINGLMLRLKTALHQEKEFSANVAHELRTPLAVILAQAQRLRSMENITQSQIRAGEIEQSAKRAAHIIDRLIQLSRAERGLGQSDEQTDANEVLELLIAEFNRHPKYENRVTSQLPDNPIPIMVDADAFGIIVSNLMENALRYSPAASVVRVQQDEKGIISIQNEGPVVRIDLLNDQKPRSGQGLGLGLSICTILAEQSGIALTITSPIPGDDQGLEARLRLPLQGVSNS